MRETLNFNRDWKFQLGDSKGADATNYNDSRWDRVGLPHSFSLPYFGATHFYTGYGWYRKAFEVPATWAGQRLFLNFEGVFQDAEIFVNGQAVGSHRGGYTGFELEITAAVHTGANQVAVRVDNLWDARLAPRAGEHVFSGGIYRNVRLVVKEPLHVAWYGTCITTPQISRESATVKVTTEVVNQGNGDKLCTVRQTLLSPSGAIVCHWESRQRVPAGGTVTFDQTSPQVMSPMLWHPDHPYLYSVRTTVLDGEAVLDQTVDTLGMRWFKWTADQGFFLNGEHLYLRGANVHQDHAGWGDAVTDAGAERDIKLVKEAGFNFTRGSHYPHAPALVAACDRLGVLLWSENAFWGIGGFGPDGYWNCSAYPPAAADQPAFEASVKAQLAEMIRIQRNHAAVFAWSMGNETFFSDRAVLPRVKSFLGELVALTHQLDPTRAAAIGGVQRPLDEGRIDLVGDIAGYNGDGAALPVFQNPGVPSLVAEYGSTTAVRPGKYEPGWGDLARDGGGAVHPWRAGQAVWCMFDHGSIAGDNLGRMGLVDYFRIPKRAFYWYRNANLKVGPPAWPEVGVPAKLGLTADKSTLQSADGTDDTQLLVTVQDAGGKALSNCVPVTLEIVSGPGEFPTGPSITFEPKSDIAILDGQAAIEFRSYYAGTSVIRANSPGLAPAEITITSLGEPQWQEGVTPPVRARPYKRFAPVQSTSASAPPATAASMSLAADRPTKVSSSAAGSSSANATDGKPGTVWQAEKGDAAPWIQLDLENTYSLNRVQVTFPGKGNYRYQIAVSANGLDWTTIVDQSDTQNTDAVRTATGNFGSGLRFLRLSFTAWPSGKSAAIAEIAVGGGTDLKFRAGQLGGTIIGTPGSWGNNPAATKEAAMDGNPKTYFDATAHDGAWVGLDLGKTVRLTRIRFAPRPESDAGSNFASRMTAGRFEIANRADFSDATVVHAIAGRPGPGITEQVIADAPPARYVRYLSPPGGSGNVAEVEFYGR